MPASRHSVPLPDIRDRDDIVRLVDRFYEQIRTDATLGPIFEQVARVDWASHLPKMYDFWDTVLFRSGTFRGDLLGAHARLVPVADMGPATFARWLELFRGTVNELFAGDKAGLILRCAEDMANVIYQKIHQSPTPAPTGRDESPETG